MFLQNKQTETLIKILDVETLFNPMHQKVSGRSQAGEEEQPPADYLKDQLRFPSGENLPRCWWDVDYKASLSS
ncbi:MAG: acetyltransferase [Cyanobacteria bacterium P01_A01_bin.17]